LPAGSVAGSPYATLMGRPVVPVQACKTVGDEGDIILTDLTQYLVAVKAGGVKTDVSMHLYFDYGQQAYRFTFRMAGQPWWNSTISPENGTNTLSATVTLAAR
jgi:HK97 family phage major capsid protein